MIKQRVRDSETLNSGRPFSVLDVVAELEPGYTATQKDFYAQVQRACWQLSHGGHIDYVGNGRYALHRPLHPMAHKPWREVPNEVLLGEFLNDVMGCHR